MEEVIEKKDYGKEFEDEVKVFLEGALGFTDVKGGPDFHIAAEGEKNQIDACGRFGDILFVFECKASGKKVKRDMRKDILATGTKAKMAFENYKRIPEYKNCRIFKFIFITKKIEVSEPDQELCRTLHMFYEDHSLLQYYTELREKIDQYAVYNFLADFGIYPSNREQLRVIALRANIGGYKVYNFYANPKELLKFAYVARRRFGKEDFYQRMLDTSRIRKIQKFLDNGGIFPTNIVISLKEGDRSFELLGTQAAKDPKSDFCQSMGATVLAGSLMASTDFMPSRSQTRTNWFHASLLMELR